MKKRERSFLDSGELIRIGVLIVLLVAIGIAKSRCGAGVATLFRAIDQTGQAPGSAPGQIDGGETRAVDAGVTASGR